MKPLNKQDVIDAFKELDKWPLLPEDDNPIIEEVDGVVYFKNKCGHVYMSMPKEDFDAVMAWDGKT